MSNPIEQPNFTPIPNEVLDAVNGLTVPELRVVLALCRRAFGYTAKSRWASAEELASESALSKGGVAEALQLLARRGWVAKHEMAVIIPTFAINVEDDR